MNRDELVTTLKGTALSDILIPGFLDQEETPVRFRALPDAVYLDCEGTLIELQTVRTTGTMRIALAEAVRAHPDLEEEMPPAVASLGQQLLNDTENSHPLTAIRLWNVRGSEADLTCEALQLDLANGQQVFIDPTYHFGIRIGGTEQREIWRENQRATPTEHVIDLAGG